jgi:hypothetical protein
MANRLENLRNLLAIRFSDLARTYKFALTSPTISRFGSNFFVQSVSHPSYQFDSIGDYQGSINAVKKPGEVTITFLEDDRQAVGMMLEYWQRKKFNKDSNIVYPKAYYAEDATLTYLGSELITEIGTYIKSLSSESINNGINPGKNEVTKAGIDFVTKAAMSALNDFISSFSATIYTFKGFYPIAKDAISLSYSDNNVLTYSVNFNVDDVTMGNGLVDFLLANDVALGIYNAVMGVQNIPIIGNVISGGASKARGN